MGLFDDLSRAILNAFSQPKPDQETPLEDKPSKPNPGANQRPFRPYYEEEPGTNPQSKPASRPPSPTASRQPSARRTSAITPSARTSSAPTLPTPSPKTSNQPSAVATSSAQSPRSRSSTTKTKSVKEIIEEFVNKEYGTLKEYEFQTKVNEIKIELENIIKINHYVKRYFDEMDRIPKYLEKKVSFNDDKGRPYNASTVSKYNNYIYNNTEKYKKLYEMLNEHGHSYLNPNNSTQNSKKGGGRGP
jgi:hypothetical protein